MGVVRTVSVALKLQVQEYVAGGRQFIASTKAMGAEVDTLAKNNKARFNDLMKLSAGVGLGLLGIAAAAEKAAIAFDKQMSEVQAVSGATAGQFEDLRNAAIEAGKATAFSATDAAQAEAELAKAGVSTADILNGGLKGALSLAAAGSLDLGDAATDTAQALNIFGLNGSAASHVADVLAAGANTSATDVGQLAYSLNQAGLVAKQTGLSLEDTTGVLADFAQHGLVGSDAGTSFKTMLQALNPTSEKTKSLMDSLGISFYDAQGNFVGITKVAGILQDKLGGLTTQQRNAAMAQIFGSDAVRAASVLYSDGAAGVQKWIDGVNDSGAAARTAQQKMNNLSGDVEQLKGSFETLAIEGSGGVTSGLRVLTQGVTGVVNAMIDMPPALSETLTVLSGVGGASILAGVGFVKARATLADLKKTLGEMGPVGASASKAIGSIGKWGGILGGVAAVGFGLYTVFDHLSNSAKPAAMNIDDLTDSLAHFAATGQADGALAKTYGTDLSGVVTQVKALKTAQDALAASKSGFQMPYAGRGGGLSPQEVQQTALQSSIDKINQGFKDTDTGLTALVTGGQTQAAGVDFKFLSNEMLGAGMSMAQINALFPQYVKAAGDVALQTNATAQGFGTTTVKAGLMTMSLEDAIKAEGSLLDVEKALNGANISMMQAEDALAASYDTAADAIKKNGKTAKDHGTVLDDSTAKGRANREALLGIVDAANKASQATLDQTGDVSKANDVLAAGRAELVKDAEKMGLSKTAAEKLADSLLKIPSVSPGVSTPGLDSAISKVRLLRTEISKLHGKTVNVTEHFSSGESASANRWGGAYEHAAVGTLRDASVYGATSPGRYFIAEPQTGGEAFVPKRGDYGRSMGILSQAAGWYGASVVTGGVGGGSGGGAAVTFRAEPGAAAALVALLRVEIGRLGGDPVKVLTAK